MAAITAVLLTQQASNPIRPINDAVSALGGLAARWRADQITGPADGDPITFWPDASGYGYTANQGTAGVQPTWRAASIGGQPAVRFDGVDDFFASPASASVQQRTVFAVFNATGSTTRAILSSSGSGGLEFRVETDNLLRLVKMGVTDIGVSTSAVPAATDTYGSVTYDGATGDYAFRVAGVAAGAGTNAQSFDASLTVHIGRNPAFGVPFAGDIAEIIVFDRVLTTTEVATVETYITARYFSVTPITITDTGSGADALGTTAGVPVSDAATGSEAATVTAATPLADTGTGSDVVALRAAVALTDAGSGTDAVTVRAAAPLTDSSAVVDAISVNASANPAANDTGSTADAVAVAANAPLTDSGAVVEGFTVTVRVSLADVAAAADAVAVAVLAGLLETASAADALAVAASIPLADDGHADDDLAAAAAVPDRDITITVGPGRSRTTDVTAAARTLSAVGVGSRTVTADGSSRGLAAAGASRTLTAEPLE